MTREQDHPDIETPTNGVARELQAMLNQSQRHHFRPGEVIIDTKLDSGEFAYVEEGLVKCLGKTLVMPAKPRTIGFFGKGSWIGIENPLDDGNLFRFEATQDTIAYRFKIRDMLSLCSLSIMHKIYCQLSLTAAGAQTAAALKNAPLKVRVLHKLSELIDILGNQELSLTQADLADMIGTDQGNISKSVSDFVKAGLIEKKYGSYVVADALKLHQEALRLVKELHG